MHLRVGTLLTDGLPKGHDLRRSRCALISLRRKGTLLTDGLPKGHDLRRSDCALISLRRDATWHESATYHRRGDHRAVGLAFDCLTCWLQVRYPRWGISLQLLHLDFLATFLFIFLRLAPTLAANTNCDYHQQTNHSGCDPGDYSPHATSSFFPILAFLNEREALVVVSGPALLLKLERSHHVDGLPIRPVGHQSHESLVVLKFKLFSLERARFQFAADNIGSFFTITVGEPSLNLG